MCMSIRRADRSASFSRGAAGSRNTTDLCPDDNAALLLLMGFPFDKLTTCTYTLMAKKAAETACAAS
jgi:hypothetical protein